MAQNTWVRSVIDGGARSLVLLADCRGDLVPGPLARLGRQPGLWVQLTDHTVHLSTHMPMSAHACLALFGHLQPFTADSLSPEG
jgi:hypothetical protein